MSKTYRKTPVSQFRKPKTTQARSKEHYAAIELELEGYQVSNRLRTRANLNGSIPSAYDDLNFSWDK